MPTHTLSRRSCPVSHGEMMGLRKPILVLHAHNVKIIQIISLAHSADCLKSDTGPLESSPNACAEASVTTAQHVGRTTPQDKEKTEESKRLHDAQSRGRNTTRKHA